MNIGFLLVISVLLTLFVPVSAGAAEDWQLKRDLDGIKIYTRRVEGSAFKQVRGVAEMDTSIASLVALVRDSDACPDWADRCGKSYVHESISELEEYVYTLNDLPWPVSDRDVLAKVQWSQNPESLAVTMVSTATTGILEKTAGVVRLVEANAKWIFTPLPGGQVEVVTEAHVNPGGPLPAWVTNMLLVDSPFKTLKGLRKAVAAEKYKTAKVSFVKEPGE